MFSKFIIAIYNRNVTEVKKLISQVNINEENSFAIKLAAEAGNLEIFKLIA